MTALPQWHFGPKRPLAAALRALFRGQAGGGEAADERATRELQTLEDQKRGTLDAMRYAASLGLTTHFDQGGFPATGTDADIGNWVSDKQQ